MGKWLTIMVVFFLGNTTFAFQADTLSHKKFLISLDEYSYIKPQFNVRSTGFTFRDVNKTAPAQNFLLPSYQSVGMAVNIFNLGLAYNFQLNKQPNTKGNFDFQTTWISEKVGIDFFIQRQQLVTKGLRQLPLLTSNFLTNGYYIFNNKRFSISPAFNQTVKQNRPAGSFLLNMQVSRFNAESDNFLIDIADQPFYSVIGQMDRMRTFSWGLMPGYAHTLIYREFYLTGMASVGFAHYWQKYFTGEVGITDLNFGLISSTRIMAGYQRELFFSGFQFQLFLNTLNNDNLTYYWHHQVFRIFVGYRFSERGIFKKGINEIFSIK